MMDSLYVKVPISWLETNEDEPFPEFYGKVSHNFTLCMHSSTDNEEEWMNR